MFVFLQCFGVTSPSVQNRLYCKLEFVKRGGEGQMEGKKTVGLCSLNLFTLHNVLLRQRLV